MEATIDYKAQIANGIRRIMALEHNRESVAKFNEVLSKIKPQSCEVKSGLGSDDGISFTLAFKKGGDSDPFQLFIDNIPDIEFRYGFIFGLRPEVFYFNPQTHISDENYDFLIFKLNKYGK